MSIILEGIDLPKGTDGLSITFHSQDGATETHILDATQAVQLPKGHGRLIDGDELNKNVHEWNPIYTYGRSAFTREIRKAPTILEAEE